MTGLDPGWESDWLAAVGGDAEFRLISRWTNVTLRLSGDGSDRSYRINNSTITVQEEVPREGTVALIGSADAWNSYLATTPRPNNHHILAMQRRRNDFFIEGHHALVQNLHVLNRVLDLMRTVAAARREDVA